MGFFPPHMHGGRGLHEDAWGRGDCRKMHGEGTAGRWLLQDWQYSLAVSTMTENKTSEVLHRWGSDGDMEGERHKQLSCCKVFIHRYL